MIDRKRRPRPWLFHLAYAAGLMVIVLLAVYASKLLTWWLGETWGTVAVIAILTVALATVRWAVERAPRRKRPPAPEPGGGPDVRP